MSRCFSDIRRNLADAHTLNALGDLILLPFKLIISRIQERPFITNPLTFL